MDLLNHSQVQCTEQDGKFYYAIKDLQSEHPILKSKGYLNPVNRDIAIQNLRSYLQNLKKKKSGNNYFFILCSDQQKKVAESRSFNSIWERDRAIRSLYAAFSINNQQIIPLSELLSNEHQSKIAKLLDHPPKFSFKIEYYKDLSSDALRGKIEYPLTKEKEYLDGLDFYSIVEFILKFLPDQYERHFNLQEKRQSERQRRIHSNRNSGEPAQALLPENVNIGPQSKQFIEKKSNHLAYSKSIKLEIEFLKEDREQGAFLNFQRSNPVCVMVNLNTYKNQFEGEKELEIKLLASRQGSKQKVLVGYLKDVLSFSQYILKIPLFLNVLINDGLYNVDLIGHIVCRDKGNEPVFTYGSKLIQIT